MRCVTFYLLILEITCGVALASEEPDGFLGFKWGASIKEFCKLRDPSPAELSYSSTGCRERFTRDYETHNEREGHRSLKSVGGVKVEFVRYYFKNNKFYRVSADYRNMKNHLLFKEALTQKYGAPKVDLVRLKPKTEPIAEECKWILRSVSIRLLYASQQGEGSLVYTYLPILTKDDADSIEKTKEVL